MDFSSPSFGWRRKAEGTRSGQLHQRHCTPIWTGIGAAGTMIAGMVMFGESIDAFRIGCVSLIVAGMIGLELASQG